MSSLSRIQPSEGFPRTHLLNLLLALLLRVACLAPDSVLSLQIIKACRPWVMRARSSRWTLPRSPVLLSLLPVCLPHFQLRTLPCFLYLISPLLIFWSLQLPWAPATCSQHTDLALLTMDMGLLYQIFLPEMQCLAKVCVRLSQVLLEQKMMKHEDFWE